MQGLGTYAVFISLRCISYQAKVSQRLMGVCDQIEGPLAAAQQQTEALLEVVLYHSLN